MYVCMCVYVCACMNTSVGPSIANGKGNGRNCEEEKHQTSDPNGMEPMHVCMYVL